MQDQSIIAVCILWCAFPFFLYNRCLFRDFIRNIFYKSGLSGNRKVIGWTKYETGQRLFEGYEAEHIVEDEIRKRKYKFGGNYHQYGDFGTPVLDNREVCLFSMRRWGEIMARIYGGDYTEFSYTGKMGRVPNKKAEPRYYTDKELDEMERKRNEAKEEFDRIFKNLSDERNKEAHEYLEEMLTSLFDCAETNGREPRLFGFTKDEILEGLKDEKLDYAMSAKDFGTNIEKLMVKSNE